MKNIKYIVLVAILMIAATAGVIRAQVSNRVETGSIKEVQTYTFFTATSTTATSTNVLPGASVGSGAFLIAGGRNVNFYFGRGGANRANTGSSLFKVQVSLDGTNWIDYNRLVANAITPGNVTPALVGTSTIGAATSTVIYSMNNAGFIYARCIAVITTDGESTCNATAEFGY